MATRTPAWAVPRPAEYGRRKAPWGFEGFHPTREGETFRVFCRTFLRHRKGRWAGKPVDLELWQYLLFSELLRGRLTGQAAYPEALLGWPRKNSKSTSSSALALYGLILEPALTGDGGAEVYAAAAAKDQARIVFGQAKAMVEASPRLLDYCKVYRDAIYVPETEAVFRVLSSDAPLQHGLNPSLVIIDELHAHKDPELYYALTTGDAAREQTLVVSISTAGFDVEKSILGQVYARGKAGDADLFFHWLEVADEDLDNPAAAKRVNPASWITPAYLARKRRSLPPAVFERLHLNRWTRSENIVFPRGSWDGLEEPANALEPGDDVWIGVDLGVRHDTAALALVGPEKLEGRRPVEGYVFGVQPDAEKPPPPAHEVIEGDRLDVARLEAKILEFHDRYNVREVVYDPWRFSRSAELLEEQGLEAVEFPQTNARMAPSSQALYTAIVEEKRLSHLGDPVLSAHVDACAAKDIDGRTWRLSKKDASSPMDFGIALCIALDRATAEGGGGFTIRFLGDHEEEPAAAA